MLRENEQIDQRIERILLWEYLENVFQSRVIRYFFWVFDLLYRRQLTMDLVVFLHGSIKEFWGNVWESFGSVRDWIYFGIIVLRSHGSIDGDDGENPLNLNWWFSGSMSSESLSNGIPRSIFKLITELALSKLFSIDVNSSWMIGCSIMRIWSKICR